MSRPLVTAERLRELLHYDPDTGQFRRIKCTTNSQKVGEGVGCNSGHAGAGYLQMRIDGRLYYAHRLAWLYMTGEWTTEDVDHINGIGTDNRIANLRPATRAQNMQNLRAPKKNNRAGALGVCKNRGRWMATITDGGKHKYIGHFDSPEAAHKAYVDVKREMHDYGTI